MQCLLGLKMVNKDDIMKLNIVLYVVCVAWNMDAGFVLFKYCFGYI